MQSDSRKDKISLEELFNQKEVTVSHLVKRIRAQPPVQFPLQSSCSKTFVGKTPVHHGCALQIPLIRLPAGSSVMTAFYFPLNQRIDAVTLPGFFCESPTASRESWENSDHTLMQPYNKCGTGRLAETIIKAIRRALSHRLFSVAIRYCYKLAKKV